LVRPGYIRGGLAGYPYPRSKTTSTLVRVRGSGWGQ